MPHREPFNPKRALVAARAFIFAGVRYGPGDPFPSPEAAPVASFPRRLIERQYDTMAINHAPEVDEAGESDPISMTGPAGGRYTINAPWLEKPLVIRGKVNAEKALQDLRDEGAPLGWIDGGTETEVEEVGGGWYQISAPWLDEPEKVQGREAAEARQREIHDEGAPADEGGQDDDDPAGEGDEGGDDNSDKSESGEGAGDGTDETPGPDDAEQAEGADKPAQGEAGADGAEAGKSDDDPATA